jgi:DMSO/TMAO reductase YedYZ molybdopterin-dependent catalytic subunit
MRRRRPFLLALALGHWALVLLSGTAALAAEETILRLTGPAQTLTLTAADFAALPRTELSLPAQPETPARTFSGVALRELLARAGAPLGDKLRGDALLTGVIVRSKDHYAVLFALAEFDENFSSRTILVADRENGDLLPPSAAPLRLVVPGDKRAARSARQITSIELVSLAKP